MRYHLAQVNVGIPLEPLESARLRGFVEQLASVNAIADAAPGFVWRLQTEDGDATAIRAFDDDRLLVNMSVWESMEALRDFVYRNEAHRAVLGRRREWFERLTEFHMVLWWVGAGEIPSLADARERLELIRRLGPTRRAFSFQRAFPSPDHPSQTAFVDDEELCPA